MFTEDQLALVNEIVPRTLRSLFVLRITLCGVAALLACVKIMLSPPTSDFLIFLISNDSEGHRILNEWDHSLNLIFSGLLAAVLALVIATFFIQARIRNQAEQELNIDAPGTTTTKP